MLLHMETADFNSSNLDSGSWDNGTLTISFVRGATYEYDDVPQTVWNALCAAGSQGQFFAQNIKNNYSNRRVA